MNLDKCDVCQEAKVLFPLSPSIRLQVIYATLLKVTLIMNTPVPGCYHPVKSPDVPSIELPFPHSDGGCGMMRVPHSDLHSNDPGLLI